jgi:low affinity Fe/Cu permease
MNKILEALEWILMYFVSIAILYFVVQIAVVFHKNALGIYKLEREIQQIHQRLDEKAPVDKNTERDMAKNS